MKKPKRVLLIMTDQQRYDTIGALGCKSAITPNLDALAADSQVFTHCYTPSPVCAPARLSLYSGLYPARHGSANNSMNLCYNGDGMYGIMSNNNVETCAIGKMHFILDRYGLHGLNRRITQEELPNPKSDDYTKFLMVTPYDYVIDYNGQRSEMYYIPQLSQLPQQFHPSQWIGDRTIEYLKEMDGEKDQFLFASFIHPHPPFAPPVPWNKLHRTELSETFVPDHPEELITYHNYQQNGYKGLSAGVDRHLLTVMKNFYYDCISFVDYQIGRIIKTLKEQELYDDTMIIFTSDHGELLGDYNCLGKRSMLECVENVPLMIKYPGQQPKHHDEVCSLVDLYPTIMGYLGLKGEENLDGIDLFGDAVQREFVYSQYANGTTGLYMIASNHDKLVYSAVEDRYQYFDAFPEAVNKYNADDPRCRKMKELLDAYIESDQAPDKDDRHIDLQEYLKDYGYRLVKQDSMNRAEDEKALLPPGYSIDTAIEYTWMRKPDEAKPW